VKKTFASEEVLDFYRKRHHQIKDIVYSTGEEMERRGDLSGLGFRLLVGLSTGFTGPVSGWS
jgi:hypothetical protein